jgi:hypothetical protein
VKNYNRDDLDEKALSRLLDGDQLSTLFELVQQTSGLLFDSVAGQGCWQSEFTDEERRTICQRVIVRMVGELFKPGKPPSARSSTLH